MRTCRSSVQKKRDPNAPVDCRDRYGPRDVEDDCPESTFLFFFFSLLMVRNNKTGAVMMMTVAMVVD